MGFHHLAIATRDTKANHEFYEKAMGFQLVKVEVNKAGRSGWAKHLFYDTGGNGMIAFWEIHDPDLPDDWSPAIAAGLGLPLWTNHIAFDARDLEDLEACKQRWLDCGLDVVEIDHGWCTSIYTNDPNQIMVEFCTTTGRFASEDREQALKLLEDTSPDVREPPEILVHRASEKRD